MDLENMNIEFDEELAGLMEERGIKIEDVKRAIAMSEEDGDYLYDGERYLAKKRFGEFTVYAGYAKEADTYILSSVYGHRVQMESEA